MRVHFCGVRGSTPAPGLPFVRYGGHTSCVALAHDGEPPTLILDAGTGLRRVSALVDNQPFVGTILLGHLHWDHVHGLPFFGSGCAPGARVALHLPAPGGDPVGVLARGMSPPHFPIGPQQLGAGWSFHALANTTFEAEGFSVTALEIPHKGGLTFGFRVSDGTATVAYLSDHAPMSLGAGPQGLGALHHAALALADEVDLLIHDAQFEASQFPGVEYLGHASVEYAISLALTAGARQLALFHHAPDRTDADIDRIARAAQGSGLPVVAASEATELVLGPAVATYDQRQVITSRLT
jgi:phosphoribosyl 1,2-cyclic phosphodiesterase